MDARRVSVATLARDAMLVGALIHTSPLLAQERDLGGCLRIADIVERVNCYDAIARAEQRSGTPVDGASPTPPGVRAENDPPAATSPRAQFGLSEAERENRRPPQERQLDQIRATVSSAQRVGAGYWQLVMSDGAVWRLTENRSGFRAPRSGDEVMIRRGSFGSYYLDADGQPAVRVRRVG